MSIENSKAGPSTLIPRKGLWLLLCALGIGMGLAAYLVWVKLRLEFDPSYVSSCNFGEKLNCDAVQTSSYSSIFGFPLALYGLATYLFFAILAVLSYRDEARKSVFLGLLGFGSIASLIHSIFLAYISSVFIGAYCIFCIGMYAVNLTVAGISSFLLFRHASPSQYVAEIFRQPKALILSALIYAGLLGVSFPAFNQVRASIKDDRIAQIKQELESRDGEKVSDKRQADEGPQKVAHSKKDSDSVNDNRKLKRRGDLVYSEVITRKGRSFMKIPVGPDDFALGPEDAAVTVVEFADFECGYCRMLTRNLAPLKKKYEGKVRWVFKHFPLNNTCNKVMKGTQHPRACASARASNCAGVQGLFWPMHDKLFENGHRLKDEDLRSYAEAVGVEMVAWDKCMKDPASDARITADTRLGRFARISGTPRMYINGHLVPGVHATEVLEYYLKSAMLAHETGEEQELPSSDQVGMIRARKTAGDFYIDAFEASLDSNGRALSKAGVIPAQTSWYEAHEACEKSGKRLCSEEEWISACTGTPAIDNDNDALFSDDSIEGRMFPYGRFHEGGRCHDNEGKTGGQAQPTGSFARCRTPSGIFDLSGNLAEWTGTNEDAAALTGSFFNYGQKASCRGRQTRFGPGYRNHTTGFRCCSDEDIISSDGKALRHDGSRHEGSPFPEIRVAQQGGGFIEKSDLMGSVSIVGFFASWCGPCKKELPAFNDFYEKHKKDGLKVFAIGVDREQESAEAFVEKLELDYAVGFDPKAISMGACGVKGMPTALVVDSGGIIRARLVGINKEKTEAFLNVARSLLKP